MQSRKIQRNERTSGSLCSAAARDPESLRAGIGPAEAGDKTRNENAREMKVEGPRPEANGSRSEAERIGASWRFPALAHAARTMIHIYEVNSRRRNIFRSTGSFLHPRAVVSCPAAAELWSPGAGDSSPVIQKAGRLGRLLLL